MAVKQRTLNESILFKGKGLHTGVQVNLNIHPAPENHGTVFKRTDLPDQPLIYPLAENVVETSRGTTIEENGARVATIEHVLSALTGMQIDNALIEIDGPEMPIMDGSALEYVKEIARVGSLVQKSDRKFFKLKEKIEYYDHENGVHIIAYPDQTQSLNVLIDYESEILGNQYATLEKWEDYEKDIAPCRTFVFFHELEKLANLNLIKGGDLDNAIVIVNEEVPENEIEKLAKLFNQPKIEVNEGILNNVDLRFSNEPARHKLLDLVGDLALIGRWFHAKIIAQRPGHHANVEFAKLVRKEMKKQLRKNVPVYDPTKPPIYDINEIRKILPHRYPFLLIDKTIYLDEKTVICVKNVTANEPYFTGHFPQEPVMPGVLQIEAMAQAGGVLILGQVPDPENYATYFMKIDKVKFKAKVVPGDTLILRAELTAPLRRGIAQMFGEVFVGDKLVCEGELMAQIVKEK